MSIVLSSCADSSPQKHRKASTPATAATSDTHENDSAGNNDTSSGDTNNETKPSPSGSTGGYTSFKNLAPEMGEALDREGTPLTPAAPEGWVWYQIEGAICRDGSPTGFYVRYTDSDKLLWYLEGGGACTSPGFCTYNQANVNQILTGDQETCLGTISGISTGRQQPGNQGIFDTTNNANPVKDWNMIYVPYCTGDIHFGTRPNVTLPGMTTPQNFVGYKNMLKFTARIVPTFKDKIKLAVLAGSSAGGFGASLNFSMIQDAFGSIPLKLLNDSGPPFDDKYMPVCMQKRWREIWGLNDSLPADCRECGQADGGGLAKLADFLLQKHAGMAIGVVSTMNDEIIRNFYAMGDNDCASFESSSPINSYIGGSCLSKTSADNYAAGLVALRKSYLDSGKYAAYYMPGSLHQHLWRSRFFQAVTGNVTMAKWLDDFINNENTSLGP